MKALRFSVTNLRNVHLYGELAPDETLKRVEFWHPTFDQKQPPSWFDWGNCPRQSTDQIAFRLKNLSPSQFANDVSLTLQALTDTTPSVPAQHFLSTDLHRWYATIDVGDLAPEGLSPVAYVRRVTPSNAVLSTPRWALTIKPVVSSWS